jgi:sulfur carrier protein ThiS
MATATLPVSNVQPKSVAHAPGTVASPVAQPVLTPAGTTGTSDPSLPFGGAATTLPTNPDTGTGISSGLSTTGGDYTFVGDFQDTYGKGTGTALADTLAGLGTATSGAVTATNQSILDAATRQQANLQATDAAHGVSPDSSSYALGMGDFASQVNQTIASTDAGIQLSEENTLISALQNEGSAHGHDSSFMDSLGDFLNLTGSVAGATSSAVSAANPAADTTILDILAGL